MNDLFISQLLDLPNTYLGEAPPEVNTCQWIVTSSGFSDTFFGKRTIDMPEYAVYVRDELNGAASARIQECLKKLQNWNDEHNALLVSRLPAYVGRDEKHRSVYSFRVQFIIGG